MMQGESQKETIFAAVLNGNTALVRRLLDNGAKVNVRSDEKTPLHVAAEHSKTKIASLLLERGAIVDARDKDKRTPLHYAVESGHRNIVSLLLDCGAKVDARDEGGSTPLHYAARDGHTEIAVLLLDRGAKVDARDKDRRTPLHYAVESGHRNIISLLLDRGAMVDGRCDYKCTPLHYAVESGHRNIVSLLLDWGAKVDARDKGGNTPLHSAARKGHTEIAILLLDRGAKVDAGDTSGNTPLHYAARDGHTEIAILLLDRGAKVDARGSLDRTPLHEAASGGHAEIAVLLLDRGADANPTDFDDNTPLHLACRGEHKELVSILLERDADISKINEKGYTALDIAVDRGYKEITELIRLRLGQKAYSAILFDSKTLEETIADLSHKDARIRKNSALKLGRLGKAEAVEPLAKALKDECPGVKIEAAWALGLIRDKRAVGHLVEALNDDDLFIEPSMFEPASNYAAEALKRIGGIETVITLMKFLPKAKGGAEYIARDVILEIIEGKPANKIRADREAVEAFLRVLPSLWYDDWDIEKNKQILDYINKNGALVKAYLKELKSGDLKVKQNAIDCLNAINFILEDEEIEKAIEDAQ
ncbi:MAG: ankyrin repeat domain-containing protein [Candidatus Methanomethylicaceae archaeon]